MGMRNGVLLISVVILGLVWISLCKVVLCFVFGILRKFVLVM